MKPIFQEELDFLQDLLNIKLPKYCWRKNTKIYLNPYDKKPILTFEVKNGKIEIKKNNLNQIRLKNIKSFDQLIEENKKRLVDLEQLSKEKTLYYLNKYKDYQIVVNHSGGKDSDVTWYIIKNILQNYDYEIGFFNTTNETANTYKHIKNNLPQDKLNIINPDIGWHQWLKEKKNYFIPSVFVRNCCSTYKEGKAKDYYDKDSKILFFQGMRQYESQKRSKYTYELKRNDIGKRKWVYILPIVEWKDEDVWLYILWKKIKINNQYYKGFTRCGCLICPFMHDYNDLLIQKYYNHQWQRWMKILEKNYEIYNIQKRLKWTLEEWKNGAWKHGVSKEWHLISKKPTKERIKELAKLKNIDIDIAKKYFKRTCKNCNKNLNSDEVGMNLKYYGRNIDPKQMICKKCFCNENNINKKEYQQLILNFINQGCNLF